MCDMAHSRFSHCSHTIGFIQELLDMTFFLCTVWHISEWVVLYIESGFIKELFAMTHFYVRDDSSIFLSFLTHNRIYTGVVWHTAFLCAIWRISEWVVLYMGLGFIEELMDVTHSHVRYDAFTDLTLPMTYSYVRYDSFTYLALLQLNRIYRGVDCHDAFLCTIWCIHVSHITHTQ